MMTTISLPCSFLSPSLITDKVKLATLAPSPKNTEPVVSVKAVESEGVICHWTVTLPNNPALLNTLIVALPPSSIIIVSYVYSANAMTPEGLSLAGIAILAVRGWERRPSPVIDVRVTLWTSYSSGTPSSRACNSKVPVV